MNVDTVRDYWSRLDAADWDGMADLLGPTFRGCYPATREQFDKAAFVRLNSEYPGRWNAEVLDILGTEDRVVTLARVFAGNGEAHVVSSWFTLAEGYVVRLDEVWAEEGTTPSADRRPGSSPSISV